MAKLEPTMFREYDVRGRINEQELNPKAVTLIAKAYGTMLRNRGIDKAVVGYDLRKNSKEFSELTTKALQETGVNVIFLGQVLTPMMYASQYYYQSEGGVMVTASHNPNGWLGFKLALGYSVALGPKEIQELKELTTSEKFSKGDGALINENCLPRYTQDVLSRVSIKKPITVVVNAGNGTAGPLVPGILRAAGLTVHEFLTEPDLDYKRYFPNPSLELMMQDTGTETLKNAADIGLAFDGDGDRLGVTDEAGTIIWPDQYLIPLSQLVLRMTPGAPIVFDSKCSRALSDAITEAGGKPVMWKTGHSYIKERLHALNAPLAGEGSGHIFFGRPLYYGFDDAVFTALKLIEVLSSTDQSLSALLAEAPRYISTPTLQTKCADELKYITVAEVAQLFRDEGYNVIMFDNDPKFGGRVEFDYGWGLLRASSNLPVLVMRCEATTEEQLKEIMALIKEKLSRYDYISDEWETG